MCIETGRRIKSVANYKLSCFSEGTSHFSPRNFSVLCPGLSHGPVHG